ncbi:MAG: right-handed parallel beta-helix repeat-containing protein [Thermoplasmata archaeon]|nr:right-handed parallel beta-helix repeat-containing protein [Thermoplasmata archaeon]
MRRVGPIGIAALLVVGGILVIYPDVALGSTYISGVIGTDTTWDRPGSPYIVTGDVTVTSGATLTIEAGVEVRFNPIKELIIEGTLNANGDPDNVTVFTSNNTSPDPEDWDGISVVSSGHARIEFCEISYADFGILLSSDGNEIHNNSMLRNSYGIFMIQSSDNNITNNTIDRSAGYGIYMDRSPDNNISGNYIDDSAYYGLYMIRSRRNVLTANRFEDSRIINLFVTGTTKEEYNHTITTSNTVEGKPVYYFYDIENQTISSLDTNHITVAGSANVTIRDIDSNDGDPIYVAVTVDSMITNCRISYPGYGIFIRWGSNIEVLNNYLYNVDYEAGINVEGSSNVRIHNNTLDVASGLTKAIKLSSSDNVVTNNTISYWVGLGIFVTLSSNNLIANNTISGRGNGIRMVFTSRNNYVANNTIVGNRIGIYLGSEADNNTIIENTILDSEYIGICSYGSENTFNNNTISETGQDGFYLNGASQNDIINNTISSSIRNIVLDTSVNNSIIGNTLRDAEFGIYSKSSADNDIHHNTILNNINQSFDDGDQNKWNDSYPSGGNYWSDFSPTCTDSYSGPTTPQTSGLPDGICDVQYDIDADSVDYYPLKTTPADVQPPQIEDVFIDGAPSTTFGLSSFPPTISLEASVDDSLTGNSTISSANYTEGLTNWATSAAMTPTDSVWGDDVVEQVRATIATPTVVGTYEFCVYAQDTSFNQNLTGSCAELELLDDMPPEIWSMLIEGLKSITVEAGAILTISAVVYDSLTGNSNIGGANYTLGAAQWATSQPMNMVNPPGSPTEQFTEDIDTSGWIPGTYEVCVYAWDTIPNMNTTALGCPSVTISPPSAVDTTPPQISQVTAVPSPQERYDHLEISAKATDNVQVYGVWVNIESPDGAMTNHSMTYSPSEDGYSQNTTYSIVGLYTFVIWANDTSNNWNPSSGHHFIIEDTTGPSKPTGLVVVVPEERGMLELLWDPNPEEDLEGYIIYRSTSQDGPWDESANVTFVPKGLDNYEDSGLKDGETYHYRIVAIDTEENPSSMSDIASGTTISQPTEQDWSIWLLLIVMIVAAVLVLVLLIRKKRGRPEEEVEDIQDV